MSPSINRLNPSVGFFVQSSSRLPEATSMMMITKWDNTYCSGFQRHIITDTATIMYFNEKSERNYKPPKRLGKNIWL